MRTVCFITLAILFLACQPTPPPTIIDNDDERAQIIEGPEKQGAMDVIINKASRQLKLSQRIARCYFMLGMNINNREAQDQLNKSIALFKEHHELLKINTFSSGFTEQLQTTEKLWNKYEAIILSKVERGSAEKVLEMSQELLELCDKNVTALCEYTNSLPNNITSKLTNAEMGKIINQAGRQRMLSQKLSLYYLAYIWDVKAGETSEQIPALLNEFSTNLNELQALKFNSEDVKKLYIGLMNDWRAIATSCLSLETQNRQTAIEFLQNTDKVTNTMNKIVALYEKDFDIDSEALSGQGKN